MNNYKINVIYGEENSIDEIFIKSLIKEIKLIYQNYAKEFESSYSYLNQSKEDK